MHTYINTHIHTYIHIYPQMHTYVCIYACMCVNYIADTLLVPMRLHMALSHVALSHVALSHVALSHVALSHVALSHVALSHVALSHVALSHVALSHVALGLQACRNALKALRVHMYAYIHTQIYPLMYVCVRVFTHTYIVADTLRCLSCMYLCVAACPGRRYCAQSAGYSCIQTCIYSRMHYTYP